MSTPPTRSTLALLVLLLAASTAGCAYFNSMYNANRLVDQADRAAERGDTAAAREAYAAAAEKADRGYARAPTGRWADDALLLAGRARFAAGRPAEARQPLSLLLADWPGSPHAAAARAYLGAAESATGRHAAALALLDSAIVELTPDAREMGLARFWRARSRLELAAADATDATGLAQVRADLEAAADALEPVRSAAVLELARVELRAVTDPADLGPPRERLLSLDRDSMSERLLEGLEELGQWLALAEQPEAELALFAAAELARDRLGARRLALRLFIDYADARPADTWAPKALLAALGLDAGSEAELRDRLAGYEGNVYLAAARGEAVGDAYEAAERRLDRALAVLEVGAARAMYRVRPATARPDTPDRLP